MGTRLRQQMVSALLALCVPGASLAATDTAVKMAADVSSNISAMKATLGLAVQRLADARKHKDIIQLNCVNDRLSIIKGLLQISEKADVALREASAAGDSELMTHEHTKVSIAATRVENLRVEVEGCVGEGVQHTGGTIVDRQVDKNIRTDDPVSPGVGPPVSALLERPGVVTGSR